MLNSSTDVPQVRKEMDGIKQTCKIEVKVKKGK
jgi:hypothetical protein